MKYFLIMFLLCLPLVMGATIINVSPQFPNQFDIDVHNVTIDVNVTPVTNERIDAVLVNVTTPADVVHVLNTTVIRGNTTINGLWRAHFIPKGTGRYNVSVEAINSSAGRFGGGGGFIIRDSQEWLSSILLIMGGIIISMTILFVGLGMKDG